MPRFRTKMLLLAATVLLLGAIALAAIVAAPEDASPRDSGVAAIRADALLVDRLDAERLLAGTDNGVFESLDGGRSWRRSGLAGRHVVALARVKDGSVWAGGPGLLARSSDGGRSWTDVRPPGLPTLAVRALAGSRDVGGRLDAAVDGAGIFRSNDGGWTFEWLGAPNTGGEVTDLMETIDGVIFLSDERRVVVNGNGDAVEWFQVLDRGVSALAPNYADRYHGLVLAGTDEGVLRTTDKGETWKSVLSLSTGSGAVAFSQSQTHIAYALARDGITYRSNDFGATWAAMG